VTPEGEHDQADDDAASGGTGPRPRPSTPIAADLGWEGPTSSQPPGERITWERSTQSIDPAPSSPDITRPDVRASRAGDDTSGATPPPPPPPPPPAPNPRPTTLRQPAASTAPAASSGDAGDADDTVRGPARSREAGPATPARPEPPARPGSAAPTPTASSETAAGGDEGAVDTLKAQLGALARQEAEGQRSRDQRAERAAGRAELTGELAQQLAATQSQVAALAAQLTTLSHRISYDLERSAQTTSERLLRDIGTIPDAVRTSLGADLGPAIDDLTDQIETDRTKLAASIAGVQQALEPRLRSVSEVVEALPLSNVEILNALQGVGSEIEDRFTRFAARVGDQLAALERSTSAELVRLRTQVDDLRASVARPSTSAEALDRMAGQVERLVQRTPSAADVVEALELLVSEHLEVLRDNLDTRVAALGPTMHEELEVVRTEALANMTSAEEVLGERVEAMEASLLERMDLAMADQIDAVDALVTDRHAQLLGTLRTEGLGGDDDDGDEPTAEIALAVAAANERLDALVASLDELRHQVEALAERPVPEAPAEDPMATVNEELKALRRRISLRLESPDTPVLTPEQIAAIAAQLADHLR
jgi:hypothetical protein